MFKRLDCLFSIIAVMMMPVLSIADEASFMKVKRSLYDLQVSRGCAPTDEDFFRLTCVDGISLTAYEQGVLGEYIRKLQRVDIRLQDILAILEAKQKTIKNYKCRFVVEHENIGPSADVSMLITNFVYAVAAPYFFKESLYKSPDGTMDHQCYSYDGKRLINLSRKSTSLPNASITGLSDRNSGFCSSSPFAQAMLYDTASFDFPHPGLDFSLFFSTFKGGLFVLEKREHVGDSECIILANESHRIFLDIKRDFSLVKFVSFFHHFEQTPEGQKLVKRTLCSSRTFSGLVDYGNGVWLPSKVENLHYSQDGELIVREKITYGDIEINGPLDRSFFENVIPENAIVFDSLRGLSYMQSDSQSINSLLKGVAKSKRGFILRYVSIISGIALIIIALMMKYRQYRKNKREREDRTEEKK